MNDLEFNFFNPADTSNWMKYVRPATTPLESNVSLTQDGDQLFFITSRNICPRQELRVSYSPQYAAERNLPVPDVLEEEGRMMRSCEVRIAPCSHSTLLRFQKTKAFGLASSALRSFRVRRSCSLI